MSITRLVNRSVFPVLVAAGAMPWPVAFAQSNQSPGFALEEVVVTARRRMETLQDTPVSVASFGSDMLQDISAVEIGAVADYAPNIQIEKTPLSQSNFSYSIRGLSSSAPNLATEPTVGLYMDGVYIARNAGAAFDMVDMERIEILRGPQGALYGRNTIGGAINLITKKPMGKFGFEQKLTFGNRDLFRSLTTVDTPEVAGFSAKLAYSHSERGGLRESAYSGDELGRYDSDAFRIALRWEPTEDLVIDYVYDQSRREGNTNTSQVTAVRTLHESVGGAIFQQAAANADPERRGKLPMFNDDMNETSDIDGHALTFEWQLGETTLKSISSYREWEGTVEDGSFGDFLSDGVTVVDGRGGFVPVGTRVSLFASDRNSDQEQWSQEFQIIGSAFDERLQYTAGLYYFHEQTAESNPQSFVMPASLAYGAQPAAVQSFLCPGGELVPGFGACFGKDAVLGAPLYDYTTDVDSYAAYGQFIYSLTDRLDITLGLRWTRDEKSATLQHGTIVRNEGLNEVQADDAWQSFNPSATIQYAWTPDVSSYFTVATGYRAGGFAPQARTSQTFQTPFDKEEVISYELGLKSEWWDRRVRFNAAGFYYEYTDQQVTQFVTGTSGTATQIVNAGESSAKGLEFDLSVLPTENLLLQLSYGYLDIKYKQFDSVIQNPVTGFNTGSGDISDIASTNVNAPENSGSAALEYTWPSLSFGTLKFRLDAIYSDQRTFARLLNTFDSADSYTLWNANVSLSDMALMGGNVRVALWGRNLGNEEVREWGTDFGSLGFVANTYKELRSFGIDVVYKY